MIYKFVGGMLEESRTETKKKQKVDLFPNVTRMLMSPAEVLLKLFGCFSRRRHVHVQRVGGRSEVWWWKFAWASGILYNQQRGAEGDVTSLWAWPCTRLPRFETWRKTKIIRWLEVALYQSRESKRQRRKAEVASPQISHLDPCVCVYKLSLTLTLPICTFQFGLIWFGLGIYQPFLVI